MPSFDQFVLGLNKNNARDEGFETPAEEKISPWIQAENEQETFDNRLDEVLGQVESSLPDSEYSADKYNIEPTLDTAEIILDNHGSPYNYLYGIVSQVDGSSLRGALVELYIKNSSNQIPVASLSTNSQGQYLFNGLSNGDYEVRASKHGYSTAVSPLITLRGNQYMVQNITMVEEYSSSITINGVITDEETGDPIEDALVALYSVTEGMEVLVQTTETNSQGIYGFINLQPGEYFVRAAFFRREDQNA